MTAPTRYFDLVREMKNPYNHRLRLVESAKQRGIKRHGAALRHHRAHRSQVAAPFSAARPFRPARSLPGAPSPVSENSSGHRSATGRAAKNLPTFGARRLIREFDLPISHSAH
jgi:hypothetical protein